MRFITIGSSFSLIKKKFASGVLGTILLLSSNFLITSLQADQESVLSFFSDHRGNFDIYFLDIMGEILHRVPTDTLNKSSLTWSPDGRSFAYESNNDGNTDIYVMDLKIREHRRLTHDPSKDGAPIWSPDGKWIAFTSNRTGNTQIYKMDVNDEKLRQLTHRGENKTPAWSPDSQWVAFISSQNGKESLYVMTADGRQLKRLADASFKWGGCTWSPDGEQIAFSAWDIGLKAVNIFIIDANGKNHHRLTSETWRGPPFPPVMPLAYRPVWSLNGHWIAYVLGELPLPNVEIQKGRKVIFPGVHGAGVICIINPMDQGRGKRLQVTKKLSFNLSPVWLPETFFPVAPSLEKHTTLWSRLKQPEK